MRARRGFTLIELLVVIAIIGAMIALLLPAIGSVRASARKARCLSNLHQIGLGMLNYVNDKHGNFPFTYHTGKTSSWIVTLSPYLEDMDLVRLCPDDPLDSKRVAANAGGIRGSSYVINEYVAATTKDGYSVSKIQSVAEPHKLILLFEGANIGRAATGDHVHTSTWYAPGDIADGTVMSTITAEINPAQHSTCSNYLYADGHAETVTLDEFTDWVNFDVANKTNFARPVKK